MEAELAKEREEEEEEEEEEATRGRDRRGVRTEDGREHRHSEKGKREQ